LHAVLVAWVIRVLPAPLFTFVSGIIISLVVTLPLLNWHLQLWNWGFWSWIGITSCRIGATSHELALPVVEVVLPVMNWYLDDSYWMGGVRKSTNIRLMPRKYIQMMQLQNSIFEMITEGTFCVIG